MGGLGIARWSWLLPGLTRVVPAVAITKTASHERRNEHCRAGRPVDRQCDSQCSGQKRCLLHGEIAFLLGLVRFLLRGFFLFLCPIFKTLSLGLLVFSAGFG